MQIEKGIPVHDPRASANVGRRKYPWDEMEVGDSFHAPASANSVRTAAANYSKKTGREFVVRKEGDGARAWRTA